MKTAKTRKMQTNKTNYMSDEAFADLKEAMEDVLAFERGKRRDLKGKENSSSPTAEGNVTQRYCSDQRKAQLLASSLCDDAEY